MTKRSGFLRVCPGAVVLAGGMAFSGVAHAQSGCESGSSLSTVISKGNVHAGEKVKVFAVVSSEPSLNGSLPGCPLSDIQAYFTTADGTTHTIPTPGTIQGGGKTRVYKVKTTIQPSWISDGIFGISTTVSAESGGAITGPLTSTYAVSAS